LGPAVNGPINLKIMRNEKGQFVKGYKPPKECAETLTKWVLENVKGKPLSEEHKKKISKAHRGKRLSEEHKQKLKDNHKGMSGRHCSEEHKRKISEANTGKFKENAVSRISGKPNKAYIAHKSLERHYRKAKAEGSHTFGQWEEMKAVYNYTCPCCLKSEPEISLTKDHIKPLTKGGSNYIENIQPLCKSCNSKKCNRSEKFYEYRW
jgi:5-methylcytosine-specific restriction endonuclease McrA